MAVTDDLKAQIADMTPDEREAMIHELRETIVELERPAPQPYPKWTTINGQPFVVDSEEHEQRLQQAADAAATAEPTDEA